MIQIQNLCFFILVQLVHKIVQTNLPQAGFELGSLGPKAGVLPIEPPLLVNYEDFVVGLAWAAILKKL